MNERILKLARKSGATVNEGYDGTKSFVYGITMSLEELDKFARLIVGECEVALKPPIQVRDVISRGQAYDLIRKHFGVEE
jgi:hypothetical protein